MEETQGRAVLPVVLAEALAARKCQRAMATVGLREDEDALSRCKTATSAERRSCCCRPSHGGDPGAGTCGKYGDTSEAAAGAQASFGREAKEGWSGF